MEITIKLQDEDQVRDLAKIAQAIIETAEEDLKNLPSQVMKAKMVLDLSRMYKEMKAHEERGGARKINQVFADMLGEGIIEEGQEKSKYLLEHESSIRKEAEMRIQVWKGVRDQIKQLVSKGEHVKTS